MEADRIRRFTNVLRAPVKGPALSLFCAEARRLSRFNSSDDGVGPTRNQLISINSKPHHATYGIVVELLLLHADSRFCPRSTVWTLLTGRRREKDTCRPFVGIFNVRNCVLMPWWDRKCMAKTRHGSVPHAFGLIETLRWLGVDGTFCQSIDHRQILRSGRT